MASQIWLNKRVRVTFLRLVQQWLSAKPRNIMGQALTLASWGILALLQRLQKIVSLKLKLLSSPLYLLSSVYIFTMFINSLPKPQLNKVGCINEMGYTNKMGCIDGIGYVEKIGCGVGEVEVRVLVVVCKVRILVVLVLALAKLFLRRQLICPKLNFPLATIYSLVLSLVHSIGSFFCRVLNSNLGTMAFLCFLTYMLLVYRSIQSFLMYIWLQFLKIYTIKFWKSFLQASHSLLSLKLQTLYFKVLNYIKSLMSVILMLLESILISLPYFFYPSLTCTLISAMLILVLWLLSYLILSFRE